MKLVHSEHYSVKFYVHIFSLLLVQAHLHFLILKMMTLVAIMKIYFMIINLIMNSMKKQEYIEFFYFLLLNNISSLVKTIWLFEL